MFNFILGQTAQEIISISKNTFTVTLIMCVFAVIGTVWMILHASHKNLIKKINKKEDKIMVKKMFDDHEKLNNEQFKGMKNILDEVYSTTIYIRDEVDKLKK